MQKVLGMAVLGLLSFGSTAAAQQSAGARGFVAVNGMFQATANDFRDGATFKENAEDGRFDTEYIVEGGPSFDVSAGATLWRRLGLGVAVSRFSRSTPTTLNASIPHPFFFSQPRAVTGGAAGLKREELGVHVQVSGVFDVSPRVQFTVFGGPSFLQVKQEIVTDFRYSDEFPFDLATFESVVTTNAKESKLGVNVGADVAFFFTNQLGVGGTVQYAGATVALPSADGGTQDVKVGGLRTGGGIRLRF